MSSWLDKLPSNEKQKIKDRFRMSASAYEKMRESVKGPEDLKDELQWNEMMAQLKFTLETEKKIKDALKQQIESDMKESGIEAVLQNSDIPQEIRQQLESGKFDVTVGAPKEDEHDQLILVPEGNVDEKIPVRFSMSETYVSQLTDTHTA